MTTNFNTRQLTTKRLALKGLDDDVQYHLIDLFQKLSAGKKQLQIQLNYVTYMMTMKSLYIRRNVGNISIQILKVLVGKIIIIKFELLNIQNTVCQNK